MSGPRFFAATIASLTAALLCFSAGPVFAAPPAHGGGPAPSSGFRTGYPGGGYHAGYSGGYRAGYNSGYHSSFGGYSGGYRSNYYGPYSGGYAPGYFSHVGGYYPSVGVGVYYVPTYTAPAYTYPSPSLTFTSPDAGDLSPAQPPGPPPPPDGTAAVGVVVPADAEVWFNGDATQQKGEQREFVTPTLPVGRAYQYEIRARWKANGQVVDQTRTVIVHSNERTDVDFTRAEPIGAPIPAPPLPK